MNVWDEANILPAAIRLRRANRCPGDIDDLYGEIMRNIVYMASVLLPKEDPRYECHREEFVSEDVQSAMLLQALSAAEKYIDTRKSGSAIVNYITKAVQNRLRNYVRDSEKRANKVDMVLESELGYDIGERGLTVCNLDGSFATIENVGGKVVTMNFN